MTTARLIEEIENVPVTAVNFRTTSKVAVTTQHSVQSIEIG